MPAVTSRSISLLTGEDSSVGLNVETPGTTKLETRLFETDEAILFLSSLRDFFFFFLVLCFLLGEVNARSVDFLFLVDLSVVVSNTISARSVDFLFLVGLSVAVSNTISVAEAHEATSLADARDADATLLSDLTAIMGSDSGILKTVYFRFCN